MQSDSIALLTEKNKTTFGQLLDLAERTASCLRAEGAGIGSIVAIFHGKQSADYALMLACLKIGAPYVVLDPDNPEKRLEKILQTCRPILVVAGLPLPEAARRACDLHGVKVRMAEEFGAFSVEAKGPNPIAGPIGTDIAYLMFTSGSTGEPKGVAISHAQVINFAEWARDEFCISSNDIFTGVNPAYFDNSVFDLYASIFNGATLAPASTTVVKNPVELVRFVAETGCTIWFSVPSLLIYLTTVRVLSGTEWPKMRAIIFGGEGYPKTELKKLADCYGAQARLVNVYGPTECTCICSAYDVTPDDLQDVEGLPPIGHLAPNFRGLLLEESGCVEAGEVGELCLLGPNVSVGYFNDPERTRQSFVTNPQCQTHAEWMYRTGDLMRIDPADGLLYFVGRKDNQIKHMGYRIELEEIESALNAVSGVSRSAVIYKRVRAQFGHIVAFVSGERGQLTEEYLETQLRYRLPEYMIPNRIEIREELPKNANGKIDRKKLAEEV